MIAKMNTSSAVMINGSSVTLSAATILTCAHDADNADVTIKAYS